MALHPKVERTLQAWHRMVAANDLSEVASLCTPDAVFRSPVAFTPYQGGAAGRAVPAAGGPGIRGIPLSPHVL